MRTLLLATDGGHLTQLVAVAERLPPAVVDDALWASTDSPQSRSVLSGKQAIFVPLVRPRDVAGVIRSLPLAHRLQREWGFSQAISTGSGVALAYLPYLALRGVRTHYIESATRLTGPSLTGRLLHAVPTIRLYTQYETQAHGRWHYGGWVYERFTASRRTDVTAIKRVVVTLGGSTKFPFRRLLDGLAPILRPGGQLEQAQGSPVATVWQTGSTPTDGLGIDAQPFLPSAVLDAEMAQADVVIGHAGAGTTYSALTAGRFPILVPHDDAARRAHGRASGSVRAFAR